MGAAGEYSRGGMSPQLTGFEAFHNAMKYSARCRCMILGGGVTDDIPGGYNSQIFWRMYADGSFVVAAPAPFNLRIPEGGAGVITTVDPVSGLLVAWNTSDAATTMYEYDPVTNAWSTISRTSPMFPGPEGGVTETIAIPISNFGVIMFVQAGRSSGGKVYLYRHAAGSGTTLTPPPSDTVAPSVPSGVSAVLASPSQINISWSASTIMLVSKDTKSTAAAPRLARARRPHILTWSFSVHELQLYSCRI